MHRLDEQDWARIERLGLNASIQTPSEYLTEVARGTARAELTLRLSKDVIPGADEIRSLHRIMFSRVHPWAGEFRKDGQEVMAGNLACTLAGDISKELKRINKEMLSNPLDGSLIYKAEIVAYYHAAFEAIHPFLDGNGRLGRLIMNEQAARLLGRTIDFSRISRREYGESLRIAQGDGDLGRLSELTLSCSLPLRRASSEDLRKEEKSLLRERRGLGFRGSELEAAYGLGGYPKPLTEEDALELAKKIEDPSLSLKETAQRIMEDDKKLINRRKLLERELTAVRKELVELSKERSLQHGLSRKLR